ncbi:MAG: ATP-binding protein [Bacteroidetes bacterium]|nr:ATP-binding protein [Bacteroidota bacterium]
MEIAIISGKGGTGKSIISAAFATLIENVVLADCDVDAANLYLIFNPVHEEEKIYIGGHKAVIDYDKCSMCGLCISYCRFEAITTVNNKITISETSCDGCFLCTRICPENAINMIQNDKSRMFSGSFRNGKMVYGRLAPGEENSGKLVNMVREKAKQVAKENGIKMIILDGPPGIGCPVISTITGVDKVVIVTEPSVSGLHDMKRTVEIVKKFNLNPWIIINKFNLNNEMSRQIENWCKKHKISVAGYLPFTSQIVNAMVQQMSIIEYNKNSEISKTLGTIYNTIIHE